MSDASSTGQPEFQASIAPPHNSVTNVHVAVSVYEVALLLGRLRQVVNPNTNTPSENAVIEWFMNLSLSPVTARNLAAALTNAVKFYEQTYAKISDDPGFHLASVDAPER